jgi:hypothetical protein
MLNRASGWRLDSVAELVNSVLLLNLWVPYIQLTGNLLTCWASVSISREFFFKQTVNCIFLMALLCGNRWVVPAREMWLRSLSQIWTTSGRCDYSRVHENISCHLPPKPAFLNRSGTADPLQSLTNFEKPLPSITSVTTPETFKTEIFVLYLKRKNF